MQIGMIAVVRSAIQAPHDVWAIGIRLLSMEREIPLNDDPGTCQHVLFCWVYVRFHADSVLYPLPFCKRHHAQKAPWSGGHKDWNRVSRS
ncbi:MAG: hypothetical protein BWY85_02277 [Firmicutes bacterium ADurb.Bin506]|nr:MAG: hypothetical protein BWY85_02277 [Firmicutes bacterium ADurb.Bin506]